jgi:hypothetical protein
MSTFLDGILAPFFTTRLRQSLDAFRSANPALFDQLPAHNHALLRTYQPPYDLPQRAVALIRLLVAAGCIDRCQPAAFEIFGQLHAFRVVRPHACRLMLYATHLLPIDDRSPFGLLPSIIPCMWTQVSWSLGRQEVERPMNDPYFWLGTDPFWVVYRRYDTDAPLRTALTEFQHFFQQFTHQNRIDFFRLHQKPYWSSFTRMTAHEVCFLLCLELWDLETGNAVVTHRDDTTQRPHRFQIPDGGHFRDHFPAYFLTPDAELVWTTRLCLECSRPSPWTNPPQPGDWFRDYRV